MSDEEKQDQNLEKQEEPKQDNVETAAGPENTETQHMIPKSRLDEEIQKRKDLEKRLGAIEKASKEAEIKRLKESEDYKKLYEQAESELATYKPKAEKVESLETLLNETLATELETIPADRRSLIPEELSVEAKLRYISRNRALLSKAAPVDLGAGERGGGAGTSVDLTPEELEVARNWGMKPEEYAKYKKNE